MNAKIAGRQIPPTVWEAVRVISAVKSPAEQSLLRLLGAARARAAAQTEPFLPVLAFAIALYSFSPLQSSSFPHPLVLS